MELSQKTKGLKTNNVNLLIQSKVLNFDWQQLINDVDLVDDKLLYFTDGWNPPRKINIEKAKRIVEELGYSTMTPSETREKLKLVKHK